MERNEVADIDKPIMQLVKEQAEDQLILPFFEGAVEAVLDKNKENKSALQQNSCCEYTLAEESVWITVGNASVQVTKADEGVSVYVYPIDREDEQSVAEAWAAWDELAPFEEEYESQNYD